MISTSFVHACDEEYMIEACYDQNISEILAITSPLELQKMQKRDMMEFAIFTEAKEEYFNESAVEAVQKLGEKIIEIIERVKEFFRDIVSRVRTWTIKQNATGKHLRKLSAENPELADKVKVMISEDKIKFATMKSMADYYKEIDRIMEEIERDKIDPKSLKGRLQSASEMLKKNEPTIKAVAAMLGLVATAGTIAITYNKLKNSKLESELDHDKVMQLANARLDKINRTADKFNEMGAKNPDQIPATKMAMMAQLAAAVERDTKLQVSARTRLRETIWTGLDNCYKRVVKNHEAVQNRAIAKVSSNLREQKEHTNKVLNSSKDVLKSAKKLADSIDDKSKGNK